MAWRSHGVSNDDLIQQLWRNQLITDERVRDAFLKVDRAHYAPTHPYSDSPQSIGHAATISAPHMHASAIERLLSYLLPTARNPAPRVLDIGSGSGYLTHVMAELVGPRGTVLGIEHVPQLRDLAEANMRKSAEGTALLESGRVRFRVGDGRKGWVEPDGERRAEEEQQDAATVTSRGEGWDVIHVGAAAVTMHPELVEQLRAPGRMFIPVNDDDAGGGGGGERVGQHIWAVDKDENGKVEKKRLFAVRYVPLTDGPGER
ncbi:protein-L-isoaspartate O-methyltransferase [Coniella lustricola]|uniref:protein-L-isoaspartate(D-aspartate) O-methyltransferase n=1 Tax=Coniella lustricola TaxID=2025994 RepID=A0A2T3A435_9PEZI|nr:protein-L-isoaspartate O-methyltransferase [Coniella lustricola]